MSKTAVIWVIFDKPDHDQACYVARKFANGIWAPKPILAAPTLDAVRRRVMDTMLPHIPNCIDHTATAAQIKTPAIVECWL